MFIKINKKDNKELTINDMDIGDTFKYGSNYYITMLDEHSENIVYYNIRNNQLNTYEDMVSILNPRKLELVKIDITITEL